MALCTAGIGVEFGFQFDRIPPNEMKSIQAGDHLRQFRGRLRAAFVPGYQRPSTVDFLMNAPFEE